MPRPFSWNVRVQSLEMNNIKNIDHGKIVFHRGPIFFEEPDVTAIYGQNGSGKTAVVDAFSVLQHLIRGNELPKNTESLINMREKTASITFTLAIEVPDDFPILPDTQWEVIYRVTLERQDEGKIYVKDERIRGKQIIPKKENARPSDWFVSRETVTENPIMPKALWKELSAGSQKTENEIRFAQVITRHDGRSFLFSDAFLDLLTEHKAESIRTQLLCMLRIYATTGLFVVNKVYAGLIYTNLRLPLSFYHSHEDSMELRESAGVHLLTLKDNDKLPSKWFEDFKFLLSELNMVLDTLIPGFSLKIHEFPSQLGDNKEEITHFELLSHRNHTDIPFRFESNGVKRIVSVLSLLISVYNDPSVCVVIDELDVGIFEFLLGQFMEILSQSGQGQLIFTSHNMRALEVLRPRQIVVTTTDPEQRFSSLKNIKPSNNTRNKYFEYVANDPRYYSGRDRIEIEQAFQKAGGSTCHRAQQKPSCC